MVLGAACAALRFYLDAKGPRLETLVRIGWIRLLDYSSRLPGADVASARDGSWGCLCCTSLLLRC
jgi:hypothetical protein